MRYIIPLLFLLSCSSRELIDRHQCSNLSYDLYRHHDTLYLYLSEDIGKKVDTIRVRWIAEHFATIWSYDFSDSPCVIEAELHDRNIQSREIADKVLKGICEHLK